MATDEERREALAAAWFASRHPKCEWSDANDWWRTKAFVAVDTWLAPLLAEWSAQDRAEALREAADAAESGTFDLTGPHTMKRVAIWLRHRALTPGGGR